MLRAMRQDIQAALDRDPAANGVLEVALTYPGVHAVWGWRLSHPLWLGGHRLLARSISMITRTLTGVEIHPGAQIGPGLFIDHATGVVIGETAEIGTDVTLYHGVTLGGRSLERGKRHPTLGDRVIVGAGAKILGPVVIGEDSSVGANAVVLESMPSHAVIVGIPAKVVRRDPRLCESVNDLGQDAEITDLGSHKRFRLASGNSDQYGAGDYVI